MLPKYNNNNNNTLCMSNTIMKNKNRKDPVSRIICLKHILSVKRIKTNVLYIIIHNLNKHVT